MHFINNVWLDFQTALEQGNIIEVVGILIISVFAARMCLFFLGIVTSTGGK